MKFEILPAHDLALAEQANVFTEAFAGYLAGSMKMNAESLARFLSAQGADLCYSRFIRTSGKLAGFGYINRTGNISRLSGMGVVPSARRAGAARHLLRHLVDEAKKRHDSAMMLEVFEQNSGAHALYSSNGFREITRLFGWRKKEDVDLSAATSDPLEEISLIAASQTESTLDYPEIPWQISRHAVAKLSAARAFRIGETVIVIGDPSASPIRVHALINSSGKIDEITSAFSAVLPRFKGREFFAPAIFPERLGEIFQTLGFTREPLNQFLMRRDL
jgi:ribosomal protein S18 acetylase RimI-like enzyme